SGVWRTEDTMAPFSVSGVGGVPGNFWAVGGSDQTSGGGSDSRFIGHSTGNGSWSKETLPTGVPDLVSVFAADTGHVYASGDGNIIKRVSATFWNVETAGLPNAFINSVFMTNPTDIWATTANK